MQEPKASDAKAGMILSKAPSIVEDPRHLHLRMAKMLDSLIDGARHSTLLNPKVSRHARQYISSILCRFKFQRLVWLQPM